MMQLNTSDADRVFTTLTVLLPLVNAFIIAAIYIL